jgi:kynurenine formamidase
MMMYIDLTQTIKQNMPVYPGTKPPVIEKANTFEKDGFVEHKLSLYSHTGTHIDAPAHMIENGKTLDKYEIEDFLGRAYLMDLQHNIPDIKEIQYIEEELRKCKFILFRTKWSRYWGQESYFTGFPVPSLELIKYLLSLGVKGFCIDTISMDRSDTTTFENHKAILGKQGIIVENLTYLDQIKEPFFEVGMLPLRVENSDGFCARAFARV